MQILANKIIRFENAFNPNGYIDLIEEVSKTAYPLMTVERRPHLTMELPTLFSKEDNIASIKLRARCLTDMINPISEYMSIYHIQNMIPKKNFITVSKLRHYSNMHEHKDDNEIDSNNFICMGYVNENFQGGDLRFPELDITYRPKSGDILIYQAKEKHEVLDLLYGDRYTFGYGLRGPIN